MELKYSYLMKVIMWIIHRERWNGMIRGMFATFGIELMSMLQVLVDEKLEGSSHCSTKHISLSSQRFDLHCWIQNLELK